jgi:chromate transporter
MTPTSTPQPSQAVQYTFPRFIGYFLFLGATGFGGPIALAGRMQQDLVEQRGWITKADFLEGLAFSQLAPGPLAAQLAIYLGYIRAGVIGATLTGLAFVLPSFLIVVALSAAYIRYGGLHWMRGVFYGIGPAVVAIIARSASKLVKLAVSKDRVLWSILAILTIFTAITEREIIWLVLAGGVMNLFLKSGLPKQSLAFLFFLVNSGFSTGVTWGLFAFFLKSSLFVFGSGLAIVPFLHGGVVQEYHWLNEQQFLDAIAVAMITPGPVVITVAFIGYLVAGLPGASAAAAGVFLPVYLLVLVCAPYYKRITTNPRIRLFVQGVTAAATGAIGGAVIVLARHSIRDLFTLLICLIVFAILWKWRVPEPITVLLSGCSGSIFYHP